jgi:small subunit ribosomal protein S6
LAASKAWRIELNDYELVTILNPDIEDENVTETVDHLTQFITSRGGEVQNIDQWGRRRLAYPIGRQMEGTYVVTHLRLQPANAVELEANLRISEDVLRHLLVRYSPAEQAAALAASQRRRPRPMNEEQQEGAPVDASVGERGAEPEAGAQGEPAAASSSEATGGAVEAAAVATDTPVEPEAAAQSAAAPGESETARAEGTPVAEAAEPEAGDGK